MFNLEQSITEWRKQMLAAGIKTPVPLEELESHLREEIERQIQSGANEQKAFEIAVREIGRAELIKAEFRKAGFFNWLGEDTQTRINRVFALLWLAYCWWILLAIAAPISEMFYKTSLPFGGVTPDLLLIFLLVVIFLRGMFASVRLFGGNDKEIRMLHFIAALCLMALVAQIIRFGTVSPSGIAGTAFNLASLVLLRSSSPKNPRTATK